MTSPNIVWQKMTVTRESRQQKNGHRSVIIWFTGLSGSGKSTISHALEKKLFQLGCQTIVLDGDNVRHGLCSDLGFNDTDRKENIRRIGETVKLTLESGLISITAFISPFREDRESVRNLMPHGDFIEVYCKASLEKCEERDVKGLYKLARLGKIKNYTGIGSSYEEPENSELTIDTENLSIEESVNQVMQLLTDRRIINTDSV